MRTILPAFLHSLRVEDDGSGLLSPNGMTGKRKLGFEGVEGKGVQARTSLKGHWRPIEDLILEADLVSGLLTRKR